MSSVKTLILDNGLLRTEKAVGQVSCLEGYVKGPECYLLMD